MVSGGGVAQHAAEGQMHMTRGSFAVFQLWYPTIYEFSVPQGWQNGVRSRSLGACVATRCNCIDEERSPS